ncbi:uncharacterized protein CANTADRAFT_25685 [Suhomyces tanzawaensis NRRL Y-17324]|uniref:Uncharacterized protein n=1 Tax=Suhomyces tanzawaensis NRRL Y-17324 TaxID=984487 RepID=A0A1E4SKA3_9ASCO|nr:uncharacterized protein CANTADRAFT_25685 [Suhomyces tanzawaensis NRRL Y-17324]ODV79867.1 hypothetical protein CANTADRAFT_25685 [Suhomyces tanzawaensis NRRL Y-17324]
MISLNGLIPTASPISTKPSGDMTHPPPITRPSTASSPPICGEAPEIASELSLTGR